MLDIFILLGPEYLYNKNPARPVAADLNATDDAVATELRAITVSALHQATLSAQLRLH